MGREVGDHGDRLAGGIVEANHGQHRIGRLGRAFGVAVAIQFEVFLGHADSRRHGVVLGLDDGLDQQLRQPLGIGHGVVELAFAESFAVRQLDHRAVVRVAAGDHHVPDAGFFGHGFANLLHHGRRRPAANVHAHDRQALVAGLDHHGFGHERIGGALREHGVPVAIAPHRRRRLRRDVALGKSDLKGWLVGDAGRNK